MEVFTHRHKHFMPNQTAPKHWNSHASALSLQAQLIAMLPPSPLRLSTERRGQRHGDEMNPDINVRVCMCILNMHAHIHISALGYCGVSCCPYVVNHSWSPLLHSDSCVFTSEHMHFPFGTSKGLVRRLLRPGGDGSCLVLIASPCTPIKFALHTCTE